MAAACMERWLEGRRMGSILDRQAVGHLVRVPVPVRTRKREPPYGFFLALPSRALDIEPW